MKGLLITVSVLAVVFMLFIAWIFWSMNVKKGEIELGTRYDAQFNVVETKLFEMRTVIKNIHKCTDEWADKFIQVVTAQASGRGGNRVAIPGDSTGVAVAASVPTLQIGRESEALGIPPDLYMKLSNAIEGKVADFNRQQIVLSDIWREHTAYCKDPYHNWFGVSLAEKVRPKPDMITSEETKRAVESGKVDENLF